jgi:hypothetical protein
MPNLENPFVVPVLSFLSLVCSLACGDVEGKFDVLFSRVRAIQKKSGNFDVRCYFLLNLILLL